MKSVYLETTVVGHIAGRLHPVAAVVARQQVTRQWWDSASDRYLLFVSDLVLAECADGDGDALHIAVAAINGIDYLATWNFKHIMNPSTQHLIDAVCRNAGIESAVICTPEQLLVTYDDS